MSALHSEHVLTTEAGALEASALSVVICGSFRRSLEELDSDLRELKAAGCNVLSPTDTHFVTEVDGFAYAESDLHREPGDIERDHLHAIRSADFVWLHSPDGYLGPSAGLEVGIALAAGLPVFARHELADVGLRDFVHVVSSPSEAVATRQAQPLQEPGTPLASLQRYYARAAERRGWMDEGPSECMLLLTEEVGELARAVRVHIGIARDQEGATDIGEELADIQLYLVHLANILSVDLAAAVTQKEERNTRRHLLRQAASG